jgi:hypothetical protein
MLPTLLLVVVADHAFCESSGNAIIALVTRERKS